MVKHKKAQKEKIYMDGFHCHLSCTHLEYINGTKAVCPISGDIVYYQDQSKGPRCPRGTKCTKVMGASNRGVCYRQKQGKQGELMPNQLLTPNQRVELEQTVGWCEDKIQRVKDLYHVNTVAGWAMNRLNILYDMAKAHNLPQFYVETLNEIKSKMVTVDYLEEKRK